MFKKDWFKIMLLVILGVFLFGIYFSYNNWQTTKILKQNLAEEFSRESLCADLGKKYSEEERYEKASTDPGVYVLLGKAMYAYSKKLNTCLYVNTEHVRIGKDIDRIEYYVIDLNNNNKIASYDDWTTGGGSCEENSYCLESRSNYNKIFQENFLDR